MFWTQYVQARSLSRPRGRQGTTPKHLDWNGWHGRGSGSGRPTAMTSLVKLLLLHWNCLFLRGIKYSELCSLFVSSCMELENSFILNAELIHFPPRSTPWGQVGSHGKNNTKKADMGFIYLM